MCLNNIIHVKPSRKEHGSSLVIAIFILVVMSVLGASMIKMLRSNEQTYAYEVLGIRAYAAAQSGAQRKLQEIFPIDKLTGQTGMCNDVGFDFSHVEGLINCKAEIICTAEQHDDINYFTITSTGLCDINGEQTSRIVEVKARG